MEKTLDQIVAERNLNPADETALPRIPKEDFHRVEGPGILSLLQKNFDEARKSFEQPAEKNDLFNWIGKKRPGLPYFIGISLLAHAVALGSFIPFVSSSRQLNNTRSAVEYSAFQEAVKNPNFMSDNPDKFAEIISTLTKEDIDEAYKKAPKLDDSLNEQQRSKIYQSLVAKSLEQYNGESSMPEMISPGSILKALKEEEASNQAAQSSDNDMVLPGTYAVLIPSEYYFHNSPYEQIVTKGAKLFFAAEGFPDLGSPDKKPIRKIKDQKQKKQTLQAENSREGFQVIYLQRFPGKADLSKAIAEAPLPLTKDNLNGILNNFMSLDEERQVEVFFKNYLSKYDADDALLASLTRDFIYKNLGTVFILGDPLSTGFDFIEQLYYRKSYFDKFVSYYRENQDTKTGTEILFCLAAMYDFEKRSILHLRESIDTTKRVLSTKAYDVNVYNKKAKSYTLQQVYQDLANKMSIRGISNLDGIIKMYESHQASIYDKLIEIGGETKNRVLLMIGNNYWDEDKNGLAISKWAEIDVSYSTPQLEEIRKSMATYDSDKNSQTLVSRIDLALGDESAKNRNELLQRLKMFHRWDIRSAKLR